MTFNFRLLALSAVFVLTISACKTSEYEAEISTVESLVARIDSCSTELANMDIDKYHNLADEMKGTLESIQRVVAENEATMDKHTAIFLSKYYAINKSLSRFKGNHKKLQDELEFTKLQLADLKDDLENNRLKRELVDQYLKEEQNVVAQCETALDGLINGINVATEEYNENRDRVSEVLQEFMGDTADDIEAEG